MRPIAATLGVLCLVLGAGSCADTAAPFPPGPPGLTFIAGNGATDTVSAVLAQALILEVRTPKGRPAVGVEVRWISIPYDPSKPFVCEAWSRRLSLGYMDLLIVDTTDASGRVRVQVQLGTVAGVARLAVNVPTWSYADTAQFTVLPGNPSRVVASVQDTAITATGGLQLSAVVKDRANNTRPDPVTYSAGGAGVSVDAAGNVATTVPTRGFVIASSGPVVDTAFVSVVPPGAFAAILQTADGLWSLVTVNLDGTALKMLTAVGPPTRPSWHPSGDRIVFEQQVTPATGTRLYVVDMQGNRQRAVAPPAEIIREQVGRYLPDGAWLYFDANSVSWRERTDGSVSERVPTPAGEASTSGSDVSPNGQLLAVNGVRIQDVAGTTATPLPVTGSFPRWSPDGTRLLFGGYADALSVVNADGTGAREILSNRAINPQIPQSWSPDGNWTLVTTGNRLDLVRVSNGEIIPLPFSTKMMQPAFKP